MKNHTTFKIGGNAEIVLLPETVPEMVEIIKNTENPLVLGKGSNVLVSDGGIKGIVVITEKITGLSIDGNVIKADCGVMLSKIANHALENSLEGFEFASGIPGTLGGAVLMNAGAYGGEMKDVIKSVTYCDEKGEAFTIDNKECDFAYRHSFFSDKKLYILSAEIELKKGDKEEIRFKMNDFNSRRKEKQPLNFPSAGSTFKRPEGYFAGKLIGDSGLKGFMSGGAQVSEKHAGFVINTGNATCKDVLDVIKHCKKTVLEKFGVELETEVKIIG